MSFKRVNLENQIFTWTGWDDIDTMVYQFYNPELLVQVGEFAPGTKFELAILNGDTSTISLMDENRVEHIFEIHLSIGRKITMEEYEASREDDKTTDNDNQEDE